MLHVHAFQFRWLSHGHSNQLWLVCPAVMPLGIDVLVAAGCPGTADELARANSWLIEQEFGSLSELKRAGDLRRLAGLVYPVFATICASFHHVCAQVQSMSHLSAWHSLPILVAMCL